MHLTYEALQLGHLEMNLHMITSHFLKSLPT